MILQNWWYTTLLGLNSPMQPPLKGDIKADVLIIGAGAAGLSAAMSLMNSGLNVVLLERNICGGSSTGKSAGFLTPDSELELSQLLRRFGQEGARDLWGVATKGIQIMMKVVQDHQIDCDLVRQDSLFLSNDSHGGWRDVQEEARARKSLGYPYTLYDADDLPSVLGSQGYFSAVRYPETYAIDPLRYAQGVKQVLLQHGVKIYEASEVTALNGHTARTHMGSVTAQEIIFCADKLKPSLSRYAWNVYHAQTFLAISEPLESSEIKAMFPEEPLQCWDTDLIYTYYRLTGSGRLLVGGGSLMTTYSHNDVTTPRIIDHVIHRFKDKFLRLRNLEFIQYWPGRIDMTRDLLPTVLRDESSPWIHYVLGCVGLPWATFCGDFAARNILKVTSADDRKYYRYFSLDRGFLIPIWCEKVVGKQAVFSLNNAWAKYYQVDKANSGQPSQERL